MAVLVHNLASISSLKPSVALPLAVLTLVRSYTLFSMGEDYLLSNKRKLGVALYLVHCDLQFILPSSEKVPGTKAMGPPLRILRSSRALW